MYIDDAAASSISDAVVDASGVPLLRDGQPVRRMTLHMEAAIAELELLGHTSEPQKEQPPSHRLESLGVELDIRLGRLKLLDGKRQAYARRAREIAARPTSPRAELVSLL
eukprot:6222075-Prymnesium_polylepis.1